MTNKRIQPLKKTYCAFNCEKKIDENKVNECYNSCPLSIVFLPSRDNNISATCVCFLLSLFHINFLRIKLSTSLEILADAKKVVI